MVTGPPTVEPRALPAPGGEVCLLDANALQAAVDASRLSSRRRMIQPFHRSDGDDLHRMFNAIQPDSYLRPHRHLDPPKAEAWIVLRGAVLFFTFEDDGRIRDCADIRAAGPVFGVDIAPGVFHTLVATEPDTAIFEVKVGPYAPIAATSFASFAPADGTPEARSYLEHLRAEGARRVNE